MKSISKIDSAFTVDRRSFKENDRSHGFRNRLAETTERLNQFSTFATEKKISEEEKRKITFDITIDSKFSDHRTIQSNEINVDKAKDADRKEN